MGAVSFNLETPSASFLAGNVGFLTGFEHIQSFTVSSYNTPSVTFSEIPQGYRHLQIRYVAKTNRATYSSDTLLVRMNVDSGSNYAAHNLYGDGAAASSVAATSQTSGQVGTLSTTAATSTAFGSGVIDILDYSNTVKNTTVRVLSGEDNNSGSTNQLGYVGLASSVWLNTAAVSSLLFFPQNGTLFSQYSTFSLYGIR